jgi:hypothetical protein
MSNSLAIAAATATLRNLLQNVPALDPAGDGKLIGTSVTTQPPDKARNGNAGNQLNLFLYQTAPNAALRNMTMPHQVKPGETGQPSLALTLYYLVTAYGQDDDDVLAHRLLGGAMSILHDHPLLGSDEIEQALTGTDLHEQLERVRITSQPLSLEEVSNLWNTFQTQYRISVAYQVSAVLIESTRGTKTPLPVLTRGPQDEGALSQADLTPPFPTLVDAIPPNRQPSVRLGDRLLIRGHHLEGDGVIVRFVHARLADPVEVPALVERTGTELPAVLPDDPVGWPPGFWGLAARITRAGQPDRTTNELVVALAPRILTMDPRTATPDPSGSVTFQLTCSPEVRPGQHAALLLGDREVLAENHPVQTATLTFVVPNAEPGTYFVRLRVDGVDSLLVDRSVTPPVFDSTQRVTIE